MKLLLLLALVVFAGSAIADSVAIRVNAPATGARTHLEFTIVIPALLYRDRVTGVWRTNVRRAGPISVTQLAGNPGCSTTVLPRAVSPAAETVPARTIVGGESQSACLVAMP
jgi:hypothetical protein